MSVWDKVGKTGEDWIISVLVSDEGISIELVMEFGNGSGEFKSESEMDDCEVLSCCKEAFASWIEVS